MNRILPPFCRDAPSYSLCYLTPLSAAVHEDPSLEELAQPGNPAEGVKPRKLPEIVWDIASSYIGEARGGKQLLVLSKIANSNVGRMLLENDVARLQPLQEEAQIRRVDAKSPIVLEYAMEGPEDRQQVIILHVLGEIEEENAVDLPRVAGAEINHRFAMKRCIGWQRRVPAQRRLDERRRKIDAVVPGNPSVQEIQQKRVATADVEHDMLRPHVRQGEQPRQAPVVARVDPFQVLNVLGAVDVFAFLC